MSLNTIVPFQVPAGRGLTLRVQLPLDDLTALCTGVRLRPLERSGTKFTVPVTTGVPVGRFTSTKKTTGLSELVAFIEFTIVTVGSCTGMRSAVSGTHVPFIRSKKAPVVPRNTSRSTLVPGTPYLLAIPHEVYCQTNQRDEQFDVVQEWT